MPVVDPCLIRSWTPGGDRTVRLGVPLLDGYLDFVAARCRPNTVLATAHDLKVFFAVVGKAPAEVTSADVLAFMTAQRNGGDARLQVADGAAGVSTRTLRRRLSTVSGLFGYLHARGDVAANPVPRGLPTRRERSRPGQGVPLVRSSRTLPRILSPAEVDALMAALPPAAASRRRAFSVPPPSPGAGSCPRRRTPRTRGNAAGRPCRAALSGAPRYSRDRGPPDG